MAVVENAGAIAVTSSNQDVHQNGVVVANQKSTTDQNYHPMQQQQKVSNRHHHQQLPNTKKVDDDGEGFKREMRDLEEMLSKLNPLTEEFVPPSLVGAGHHQTMFLPSSLEKG